MVDKPSPSENAPASSDAPAPRKRRGVKRTVAGCLLLAGAGALAWVWYHGSRIDGRVYSVAELSRRGTVAQIVAWKGDRTAVQISRLSSLPADALWRVATDQGRFDEFMPYVRSTTVRPGPDGTLIETQWLDLPHASYDLELTIRISEQDNVRRAGWEQTRGELSFNEGAWIVEDHGERSILRYQVSAELDWAPQWVVNYAMRRRLGRLLDAVEQRVRELQRREPEYFLP